MVVEFGQCFRNPETFWIPKLMAAILNGCLSAFVVLKQITQLDQPILKLTRKLFFKLGCNRNFPPHWTKLVPAPLGNIFKGDSCQQKKKNYKPTRDENRVVGFWKTHYPDKKKNNNSQGLFEGAFAFSLIHITISVGWVRCPRPLSANHISIIIPVGLVIVVLWVLSRTITISKRGCNFVPKCTWIDSESLYCFLFILSLFFVTHSRKALGSKLLVWYSLCISRSTFLVTSPPPRSIINEASFNYGALS